MKLSIQNWTEHSRIKKKLIETFDFIENEATYEYDDVSIGEAVGLKTLFTD